MWHVRHYGFLAPAQRSKTLETIRALLGAAQNMTVPDEAGGGGNEVRTQEPGRACPHCGQKTLVPLMHVPRPTVAEIMRMPLQAHRQLLLPLQMEYP